MLLQCVMKFSHNLIDFRDDWAASARSRKVSRVKECGDAATIRGGGSGWPRLARCRAGDRQLVAWAKTRSQRLGGGASNFAGNRFQDSPGARGECAGSATDLRMAAVLEVTMPFPAHLGCLLSASRLAELSVFGCRRCQYIASGGERSLIALQAPNDVRLRETQMIKCAINLRKTQQRCRGQVQAIVFNAKRPPDRSDGRLQNPLLRGNCDQLAATCPPARRSAAARRSTSASATVRASATHFSSTMSRP